MTDWALWKTLSKEEVLDFTRNNYQVFVLFLWAAATVTGDCLEVQVQFIEITYIQNKKVLTVKFHVMGQCFSIEPAGAIEDSGHCDLDGTQCWWIPLETTASSRASLGEIAAVIKMRTGAWCRCSPEPITINNAKCRIEINVSCRNMDK